ncbi:MAG: RNA pseudouridine synthase [Bacteroidales bacterium]|nr:RNA pseudouridine synthase [Bacteroidales bacterium]
MSSEIVQGDKTGDEPLSEKLKTYLKIKYNKPGNVFMGVVHRLDRPVSGAIIFAKTGKALSRLNKMVKEREIKKTYWAIVKNKPVKESAHLINYLKKNQKKNKSFICTEKTKGGLKAELKYNLVSKSDKFYLLEINLLTGRHHQIRAQMAHIGSPIKGDIKYGYHTTNKDASINLHARKIEFIHPVKKEKMEIIAPVPDDPLWKYF